MNIVTKSTLFLTVTLVSVFLITTQVVAADMSGWSDKTVCRLVKSGGHSDINEEATLRKLDCEAPEKSKKKQIITSGDIIEGDWKGGEMIGIQTSLDGTKKEGVFRNGKFQIGASASYAPVPKVKSKQVIASGPVITEYKGRIVASKYRDKKGTLSFNCPQGVVSFTSMEWPHKGQTSAQFTYGGGSSTIRGKLNKESKVFEGDLKQGEYFILHMKGVIKEDRAEGSVWIEIVNFPVYNTNGLCVGNFIAYPSR